MLGFPHMPKPAKHKRSGPKSTRAGCLMCKPYKRQGGCDYEHYSDRRRAPATDERYRHARRRSGPWVFWERAAMAELERSGKVLLWAYEPRKASRRRALEQETQAKLYQQWLYDHRPDAQAASASGG